MGGVFLSDAFFSLQGFYPLKSIVHQLMAKLLKKKKYSTAQLHKIRLLDRISESLQIFSLFCSVFLFPSMKSCVPIKTE